MERRSFIRSLLAGLALAPVAKCLIDLPAAPPPEDAPPYRGLGKFKAKAERDGRISRSSFAAWDKRVGRALLS